MKKKRGLALILSLAMAMSSMSPVFTVGAFAANYADGAYSSGSVTVQPDEWEDFDAYDLDSVTVTVTDGSISDLAYAGTVTKRNQQYMDQALEDLKAKMIAANSADVDISSGATCSSNALKQGAAAALANAAVPKPTAPPAAEVDTTALEAAIAAAQGLNEADYTAESWAGMTAALEAAQAALSAEDKTQESVDAAAAALNEAVAALEAAPPAAVVDTAALEAAIAAAQGLNEADYTAESLANMTAALEAAQAALSAEDKTQESVDAAAAALNEAVAALEAPAVAGEPAYVWMNIPYDAFYKAELTGNEVPVDAFSSATQSKTTNSRLAAGTYHHDSSSVDGITYPVYVEDSNLLTGYTQVETLDALFENEDYAYCVIAEADMPAYFKQMTAQGVFAADASSRAVPEGATVEVTTDSSYGDYGINVNDLPEDIGTIYGVVLETGEGVSYGLRQLENIWVPRLPQLQLAVCTGFTTTVHGCPTSSAHYESIMGKTLSNVVLYTSTGVYNVAASQYLPITLSPDSLQVEDGASGTGSVAVTASLPEDFAAAYAVEDQESWTATAEQVSYTGAQPGEYTLIAADESGKYAALRASFLLSTTELPAAFDADKPGVSAADGFDEEAFAAYLANISGYVVNDTEYSASGHFGVAVLDETGTVDFTTSPFADAFPGDAFAITVRATGYPELSFTVAMPGAYVLMDIPYDAFYKAELTGNEVPVDAFSSATQSKTTNANLAGGSYHHDSASIDGVTYPVYVADAALLEGLTQVESEDALFENVDYAYCLLTELPAFYKQMTLDENGTPVFAAEQAARTDLTEAAVTLSTESRYGDYGFEVEDLPEEIGTVYGVVLETGEGVSYGLRCLENIWRKTELAICTGFTTEVHGCPTSSAHYESIMGKTLSQVVYYTDAGVYQIPVELYLPITLGDILTVENGSAGSGSVQLSFVDLPQDFDPVYTVEDLDCTVTGTTLAYTDAAPGSYTLQVQDANGLYVDLSADFVLSTDTLPLAYDNDALRVLPANGASQQELSRYLSLITAYEVEGTSYSTAGSWGSSGTLILNENGFVDLSLAPFDSLQAGSVYQVTATATGYPDFAFTITVPDTLYAYASLSYGEYWAAEGVYAAGNTTSVDALDSHNEADLGGFDAVSRATVNHGLHRGSFQQVAVIHTESGTDLSVAYWNADGASFVTTDGITVSYSKANGVATLSYRSGRSTVTTNMTGYEVTGIKYVPVAIAANDFVRFCRSYTVTQNGETLAGGYSENQLSAYTAAALVDANTNGLKTAVASGEGFTFTARQNGNGSGLLDQSQATYSDITVTVNEEPGNYGEFLRVDLNGSYGGLGAMLQTVQWTYYGDDSTYTTPLQTYGTKFAADNWMHKSMGIQLGLTESLRCQLPQGTDGSGYWSLTVYSLGGANFSASFQVASQSGSGSSGSSSGSSSSGTGTSASTVTGKVCPACGYNNCVLNADGYYHCSACGHTWTEAGQVTANGTAVAAALSPKTGDTGAAVLAGTALLLCLAGGTLYLTRKRKEQ